MAWSASNAIVIACVLSVLTPLVTYVMSVQQGHVDPLLPYISTTGTYPPESTVFTQLVVLTTVFLLLITHIRFVYVALYCEVFTVEETYTSLNFISLYFSYIMCLGLLVLGCFQETNAYIVHHLASVVLFTFGCFIYTLLQTILSYRLRRFNNAAVAAYCRIALAVLILISMLTYLTCFMLSIWKSYVKPEDFYTIWKYDLIGAASQWLLIFLSMIFMFTFRKEFHSVKLTLRKIHVIIQQNEETFAVGT